jgi:hypothetical protein
MPKLLNPIHRIESRPLNGKINPHPQILLPGRRECIGTKILLIFMLIAFSQNIVLFLRQMHFVFSEK